MNILRSLACLVVVLFAGCSLTLEDIMLVDGSSDGSVTGDSAHDAGSDVSADRSDAPPMDVSADGSLDAPVCPETCVTDHDCLACPTTDLAACCKQGHCQSAASCDLPSDASMDVPDGCGPGECSTTNMHACTGGLMCCASVPGAVCGTCETSCSSTVCPAGECSTSDPTSCGDSLSCCPDSLGGPCGSCAASCGPACPPGSCSSAATCSGGEVCCPDLSDPGCGTCASSCTTSRDGGMIDSGLADALTIDVGVGDAITRDVGYTADLVIPDVIGGSCTGSGMSVCAAGLMCCGGECVNDRNDPQNCGACGATCVDGQTCESGVCRTAPCAPSCGTGAICCEIGVLGLGLVNLCESGPSCPIGCILCG